MSESTADAVLRWREKELRAAWEMGRGASLAVCRDRIHFHTVIDYDDENDDLRADGARGCAKFVEALTPPDNLGGLVKEQAGER